MLHVEAKQRVTHVRREQVGTFNSRLARRWERKYRIVVRKELRLEMREAADRVEAGRAYRDLQPRWQERLVEVQRPLAIEVAAAGYRTAQDMFGPGKSGAALLEGKQVVPGFGDRGEMIALKVQPNVDRWLKGTTKSITGTSLDRLTVIVDRGRLENKTVGEIATDIRVGIPGMTKHRAELISRSATMWLINDGLEQSFLDMGIKVKEWLAGKDDLTCQWCRPMDGVRQTCGKEWFGADAQLIGDKGSPLITGPLGVSNPPLHPQCRCTLIPVVPDTPVRPRQAPDKPVEPKPDQPSVAATAYRTFATNKKAKRWADKAFKEWKEGLSDAEQEALWRYQGSVYDRINGTLRSGKRATGRLKEVIDLGDSAIAKGIVRENVTVYRGFSNPDIVKNWTRLEGKIITDKGFTSTSLYKDTAEYFRRQSKGVLAEIRVPEGARGAWIGALGDASEGEFLLPRGSKFKVTETFTKNKVKNVVLELIL